MRYSQTPKRMWAIRAGIKGTAHPFFVQKRLICLADPGIGDLRKIIKDRSAFYACYSRLHPRGSPVAVKGIGGKFFRFIHEIHLGDLIIYPALKQRRIYLGEVAGEYRFSQGYKEFPHQRAVNWLLNFPKASLSVSAGRELGAARTLFEIRRHREEFEELLARSGDWVDEGLSTLHSHATDQSRP